MSPSSSSSAAPVSPARPRLPVAMPRPAIAAALLGAAAVGGVAALAGCGASRSAASPPAAASSATKAATAGFAGDLQGRIAWEMPRGLTTMAATTMGSDVYVLGGYFGRPHAYSRRDQSDEFRVLSLDTGQWASLPSAGKIQSAVLVNDGRYVYRIGGMRARNEFGAEEDMHSVVDFSRFDPAAGAWQELTPLPAPRSSHQAVLVDGTIYVLGGWALAGHTLDHEWGEDMLTCDLGELPCEWKSQPMPVSTRAMGAVAHEGKIYVLGGLTPEGGSEAVHIFDTASGKWSDGPALPKGNLTIRGAVWRGRVYANGADGAVYRLSLDGTRWDSAGRLRFARMFHQLVGTERGLVALGGIPSVHRGARVRHVELLNDEAPPAAVSWTIPAESAAKNRQGVFLLGQQLYVFGGNNSLEQHDFEPSNFESSAWRLDLGTMGWSQAAELPAARQSQQTVIAGSEKQPLGLAIGGFGWADGKLATQPDIFLYDFRGESWRTLNGAMPEARSQFGLATYGGRVWLLGGLNYDASREEKERFRHPMDVLQLDLGNVEAGFVSSAVSLAEPRRAFAGAQIGSHYYLTGGLAEGFGSVTTCRDLDLATGQSAEMSCPSSHRLGGELVPLDGKLYLVGGSVAGEEGKRAPTSVVEVYEPEADRWATLTESLPLDSAGQLRAFAFEGQLLLYTANREDGQAQVALLNPTALRSGQGDLVKLSLRDPD